MIYRKINELFNLEKGILQSSKCVEGEFDFITASINWKKHNEYSHDCEALIFAAAASGSLGRTHYVNGKFISSDLCFILIPKDIINYPIDLKFYQVIFNIYKSKIVSETKSGTSKEAISLKSFGNYKLPYFEIDIQQRVKTIFGKAELLKNSLLDEYSSQLSLIENLNQAILQEAVQGKLVPQDLNDEPASELLKRIKEERLKNSEGSGRKKKEKSLLPITPDEIPFDIPESWVWCRLGEVVNSTSGGTPDRGNIAFWNGNISWLKSGELTDGVISKQAEEKITEDGFKNSSAKLFPKGTLLIALYGATAGKLGILNFDSTTNQAICGFFENEFYETQYLFYFLLTFRNKIIEDSWGQAQPNISQTYLKNFLFPLPPLSEQKRIVAEIENQFAKNKKLKDNIIANQEATEDLLKALLQDAFESL